MTIFSYFPAPLSWKPWHVPDNLELRKSADTDLYTSYLVSEYLEVSRIQWWCRKKCRLSTRILRELTIFSNFPALLRWQHFHVPVNLELRKSAYTEVFTPHLVSEHLEVSRIQWWCRKNADFRPEFCENWRFSAISPHCWAGNLFMFLIA